MSWPSARLGSGSPIVCSEGVGLPPYSLDTFVPSLPSFGTPQLLRNLIVRTRHLLSLLTKIPPLRQFPLTRITLLSRQPTSRIQLPWHACLPGSFRAVALLFFIHMALPPWHPSLALPSRHPSSHPLAALRTHAPLVALRLTCSFPLFSRWQTAFIGGAHTP